MAQGRALGCRLQADKPVPLSRGQWEPLKVSEQGRGGGQEGASPSSPEHNSREWEEGRG